MNTAKAKISEACALHQISVGDILDETTLCDKLAEIGFELPSDLHFEAYMQAINNRFPERRVIPLAKSCQSDETVAFVIDGPADGARLIAFHDFATPGWEQPRYFSDFEQWFRAQNCQSD